MHCSFFDLEPRITERFANKKILRKKIRLGSRFVQFSKGTFSFIGLLLRDLQFKIKEVNNAFDCAPQRLKLFPLGR